MSKLPLFEKNAYLSVVIKDDGVWSHLAYTDYNANREYILSDFTDLHPLRHRLDDDVFSKDFWLEYFTNLEKVFSWEIVDKSKNSLFTFQQFKQEGVGVNGIRMEVDDNQKFFDKIFASIRDFSKDISLRVIDDKYMQKVLEGLLERTEYDDIIYVDIDLMDFSVFRAQKTYKKKQEKVIFSKAKVSWKDSVSLVESIGDSRFKAFLATELGANELFNHWANFVFNRIFSSEDPNLIDILRAYCTIQNHSIYRDNHEKLEGFGTSRKESCLILSGHIPRVLGKPKTLLTLIDGLELEGTFDCCWDLELKLLSYAKSYIEGTDSTDIILTSDEILSLFTKVVLPKVKSTKSQERVIFAGKTESLGVADSEIFAFSSKYNYIDIPEHSKKMLVEGAFKNGAKIYPTKSSSLSFLSSPEGRKYESLLIDSRKRPVVYGPDSYTNKLKLQNWLQ